MSLGRCGKTVARVAWSVTVTVGVTLLVSTLFVRPLLAQSGGAGPVSRCQDNLKRLSAALSMYMGDYEEVLPSSMLYGHSRTWNPNDFMGFAKERGTLPPTGAGRMTWPMVIYPYISGLERPDSCLWCPMDHSAGDSPSARVSYYWRAATDAAWYGGPDGDYSRRHEGDYAFPDSQIILYERYGWHFGNGNQGLTNGAIINCAFMDGHVSAVEIRNSGYGPREVPAEPLPRSGVGEPAWFNYSLSEDDPSFSTAANWDPEIWEDNLREVHLHQTPRELAASCQANMMNLGRAVRMYMGDYDGALPSSYQYSRSPKWSRAEFVKFAALRGTLPPRATTPSTWPMLMYPYLKSKSAIWCPADRTKSDNPSAIVSYYWKAALDAGWYGGPGGKGNPCRYDRDLAFPAQQMVLYERLGWHSPGNNRGLTNGVSINCVFLDGHVSAHTIRDSGYGLRENPPLPLPISGVGEPAWFNYSYGTAAPSFNRGANWDARMWGDNLP